MTSSGRLGRILFRLAYICNSIDKCLIQNRKCEELIKLLKTEIIQLSYHYYCYYY